VIVTGVGKSGIVGRKLAASLASLGTPAYFVHATEAVHGDLGMIASGDVVIALSYSGGNVRTGSCCAVDATNRGGDDRDYRSTTSTLARLADVHLDIGVREEADRRGLAPTTSAIATMALGDALALAVAEGRGFTREQFGERHPGRTKQKPP
jgi:arabinose-5-phosphate isomerase